MILKANCKEASRLTYLTIILNAPKGVTRTAGANAYATKLATSPTITISKTRATKILLAVSDGQIDKRRNKLLPMHFKINKLINKSTKQKCKTREINVIHFS